MSIAAGDGSRYRTDLLVIQIATHLFVVMVSMQKGLEYGVRFVLIVAHYPCHVCYVDSPLQVLLAAAICTKQGKGQYLTTA